MAPLTTDEKIDYIYKRLKRDDKRAAIKETIKWVFRLTIVCFIIYFYLIGFQKLREEMIQSITPGIPQVETQGIYESISNFINKAVK